MAISSQTMLATFKEMGLEVVHEGNDYVHTAAGNHAPVLHSVTTIDEDGNGATLITALSTSIPEERRTAVCELLNLVHGQSLWNVRFHLDDAGRVFSVGKHMTWGKPFNPVQFGDIFFSLLVSTDRLHVCLEAVTAGKSATEAFEQFFGTPAQ